MNLDHILMARNMRTMAMAFHRRMERDDDLILFTELQKQKRETESNSSLLQPVSADDYEYDFNGKFSLYRIPSGKKESGNEFLAEEANKNDYDWLKTPPATPLFPSLEMEAGAPSATQLLVQKELPIIQPLSRFAGSDSEASKPKSSEGRENPTNSSKIKLPMRSITPSYNRHKPTIVKNTDEQESSTLFTNRSSNSKLHVTATANNAKTTIQKQSNNVDNLTLNLRKNIEANDSQRKPKSRGISPLVRSSVVAHIAEEFPNQVPLNPWTDHRSTSATRGRISNPTSAIGFRNQDPTPRASRQPRSPSPSMSNSWNQLERTQKQLRNQKERSVPGTKESRTHVMGSKMVEKVVNARKSATNQSERETKSKPVKHRV